MSWRISSASQWREFQKYSFPWNPDIGIWEKIATNCLFFQLIHFCVSICVRKHFYTVANYSFIFCECLTKCHCTFLIFWSVIPRGSYANVTKVSKGEKLLSLKLTFTSEFRLSCDKKMFMLHICELCCSEDITVILATRRSFLCRRILLYLWSQNTWNSDSNAAAKK